MPLLWLPYVTHPVDANARQSGILIPEIGFNSASKGETVGEQVYWAINRSTELTVGTIFYSARGWEQTASFHYRGLGQDLREVALQRTAGPRILPGRRDGICEPERQDASVFGAARFSCRRRDGDSEASANGSCQIRRRGRWRTWST